MTLETCTFKIKPYIYPSHLSQVIGILGSDILMITYKSKTKEGETNIY